MTSLDIVQQRLHNQHLIGAPFARPDQVVHWFGAVQAQEYPGATWGIAQRLDGVTQTTIDQAYADGAILRTHAMVRPGILSRQPIFAGCSRSPRRVSMR